MTAFLVFFLTLFVAKDPVLPVYQSIRKQGDKLYQAGDYRNALLMYAKYYHRYQDARAAEIMADCYWRQGNYDSAFVYLERSENRSAQTDYRFAELCARKGNYAEASKMMDQALLKANEKEKELFHLRKKGYDQAVGFKKDSADWSLRYLAVNTKANETSPVVFNKELFIVSNRSSRFIYPNAEAFQFLFRVGAVSNLSARTSVFSGKNNEEYNRRYASDVSLRSGADSKVLLPGIKAEKLVFNGTEIEKVKGVRGSVCFTDEGVMYYSKEVYSNGKIYHHICSKDQNGYITVLPVNENYSSSVHPFVSDDGKQLYFSSNRMGGKGGFDLYVSTFVAGKWSAPENLKQLNTAGDEMHPALYKDKMYFSSNGWPGLGGTDIFSASINNDEDPMNVGYPLNSSADDEGISLLNEHSGFISSNRHGGFDVLQFNYASVSVQVKSFILNAKTGLRMPDVFVLLEQESENGGWKLVDQQKTTHTGVYSFSVKPNRKNYRIRFKANGFVEAIRSVNTNAVRYSVEEKPISLVPVG